MADENYGGMFQAMRVLTVQKIILSVIRSLEECIYSRLLRPVSDHVLVICVGKERALHQLI